LDSIAVDDAASCPYPFLDAAVAIAVVVVEAAGLNLFRATGLYPDSNLL